MERIGIISLSLSDQGLEALDRVVRPATDSQWRALADTLAASELVVLSTCNRIEVIFGREEGQLPGEEDALAVARALAAPGAALPTEGEGWRLRSGRDAVRRLFRITSSLDSLVLGEVEIQGQVRESYARAADLRLTGRLLGPLFHHALQIGKSVRSSTDLSRHPVSLASLAVRTMIERRRNTPGRVAIVGAGQTGALVARVLSNVGAEPVLVANRSLTRAQQLADRHGAVALSLDEFAAGRHPVDVIFSATSADGIVLDAAALARLTAARVGETEPLLIFDLAVPRDVEPGTVAGVEIVDIAGLKVAAERNRALRAEAGLEAERLVDAGVDAFFRRQREDVAGPAVRELKAASEELFNHELRSLLEGPLAHLTLADRRLVERWARATFGRLMTLPVSALKQLAANMAATSPGGGAVSEEAQDLPS